MEEALKIIGQANLKAYGVNPFVEIEEKDLNFSEFAEYGGGVEEGEEFRNDVPVDSKGMTGIPDEDFTGVTEDR